MPDEPIQDPRIREAMEACRAGSDDLEDPALALLAEQLAADPELAAVFEDLQRVDAAVAKTFRDVPVPDGLADRITARLASVRNGRKASAAEHKAEAAMAPVTEVVKRPSRLLRRGLLAGAASLVAAASLVMAVFVADRGPEIREIEDVCDAARTFFDSDSNAQGTLVAESQPPAAYPPSPDFDVSRFPQIRWRPIRDFSGLKGVAYDIRRRQAPRATLYVVQGTVPGLPATPPLRPTRTTGNRSIGVWQTGELLYVLVVEGGSREYQRFLPSTTWT